MKITLPIGDLFSAIAEFKQIAFQDKIEQDIRDLNIQIDTPDGLTVVKHAITKNQLQAVKLTFSNGSTLDCALHHILINEQGRDLMVSALEIGDNIVTRDGMTKIVGMIDIGVHDCYDIGIDAPHRYYDSIGILHHNTIMTAVMSMMCEPYGKTIVIVPSKSLVLQTEEDYKNLGLDVGVFFGERKEMGKTHTICTWQSLSSLAKNSKDAYDDEYTITDFIDGVVGVIVDECLDGDSPVLTPDGYKSIKTLEPGDIVINYCESTKTFKNDTVVKLHTNLTTSESELMYECEFDTGDIIAVTGNHKFLSNHGWIRADTLTAHDEVIMHDTVNYFRVLTKRTVISKPEYTYNLHIENDHNYVVNGLVVANCHSAKGTILKDMLVGPLAGVPIRIGLTGTIPKEEENQMSLLVSIGPIVGEIRAADLQEKGVLARCHVNIIQLDDSHVEYKDYTSETKYLTGDLPRVAWLSKLVEQISQDGNTLILVSKIETGKLMQSMIPNSVFVNGSTKSKDRIEEYKDVRTATNKVMIATYGVAAVGLDIPRLFNVVLIEPGKSFVRVIQSIGRGIRKAGDKDAVNIWDLTSTLKYSSKHLITRKEFYKDAGYPMNVTKVDYRVASDDVVTTTTKALSKSSTKGLNKKQIK